jgi:lipopolysaccharide export system permease protein
MMPGILSRYIAKRFAATTALIIGAGGIVIFAGEYVETLRRLSGRDHFTPLIGAKLAALRVPLVLDDVLSFVFLFGALISLLALSGRLELVIARASGVSVWGFLRPALAVALIFGALTTTVTNPLAVAASDSARRVEAELAGSAALRSEGSWFRQDGASGESIVYAGEVIDGGLTLLGVTAIIFAPDGRFREKVAGPRAEFGRDRWVFETAEVVSSAHATRQTANYELPTELTAAELRRSVNRPKAASVWSLPGYIIAAERTGINADRFRVWFHTLLGRPLFLLAMVAIAATVSLRLSRYGGTWRLILTGVGAGFLLYVFSEIVSDLGEYGIINPVLAAWLPPIVALTFGATALLHQEDG